MFLDIPFYRTGVITTLPAPSPLSDSHRELNDKFMQAALRSIGPCDALEALLAVQMVRTHNLAISDDRKGEAAQGCRASCDCPAYPLPTLAILVWPSPHRPDEPQWV